ncbi:hypothetical protein ACK3TF_003335 [Chlorella vulgaris]
MCTARVPQSVATRSRGLFHVAYVCGTSHKTASLQTRGMQPAGSHSAYAGFTPALQFPGQQQHQAQQPAAISHSAQPAAPQLWQGASQQAHQQQDQMAGHQASQGRVMRPAVARPPAPASLLQQPQHYHQLQQQYAHPQQYAQPQYQQQTTYGSLMQAQQLGTPQWPPPPTLAAPPPAPAAHPGLQQHSSGAIMRPQRHAQPPPYPLPSTAASPGFSMPTAGSAVRFNPNTGAPIPQLPSLAAPPLPMPIMRNPNTGAPIYPPGHSMLLMRSAQASQQQASQQQASQQQAFHQRAPAAAPGPSAQGQGLPAAPAAVPPTPAGTAGRDSPSKPQAAFHQQYGGRTGATSSIGSGSGYGGAGGGRGRTLLAPPAKRLRKKDIALPPERLVEDPVARAPQSAAEAAEVAQWVKERKRFFPTVDGVARKQAEAEARRDRGELEAARTQRQQRLAAVLAQQSAMGLSRAAGTLDMYMDLQRRGGGRGRGRSGCDSGGRSGRGAGRGAGGGAGAGFQQQQQQRQQRGFGWESFLAAGEPPAPQQQQQQQPRPAAGDQGLKRSQPDAAGTAVAADHASPAALQADTPAGVSCASPDAEPAAKRPRMAGSGGVDVPAADDSEGGAEGGEAQQRDAAPPPLDASQQQLYQQHLQQQAGGEAALPGGGGRGGRGGARGGDARGRGGRGGRLAGRGEFAGGRGGRFAGEGGRGRGGARCGRGVSWEDQQAAGRGGRGGGRGGRDGGRGGGRGGPHQQQQQQQQDHSALLQAFRFIVRNNFLLEAAAGTPLEFPPPPAYPPAPAKALWGQRLHGEEEPAAATAAAGTGDVQALLAAVAHGAIDVELSDEEEDEEDGNMLLLPAQAPGTSPAAPADLHVRQQDSEGGQQEGSGAEQGSSSSGSSDSDSEAEEGQLMAAHSGGGAVIADALVAGVEAGNDLDFS